MVDLAPLAEACAKADIVISQRYLPRSCRPRWLKADRRFLEKSGGLAIDLADEKITTVAESQGEHGWWRDVEDYPPRPYTPRKEGAKPVQSVPDRGLKGA